MNNVEAVAYMQQIEKANALEKMDYWKSAGKAVLDSEELTEKWSSFVEATVNNNFARGALLDEALQILTMIRAGIPAEIIAKTASKIPNAETVLQSYLGAFVKPEILYEIQENIGAINK